MFTDQFFSADQNFIILEELKAMYWVQGYFKHNMLFTQNKDVVGNLQYTHDTYLKLNADKNLAILGSCRPSL